jgi:RNA polymerase sigma factor (sigma-70 family)
MNKLTREQEVHAFTLIRRPDGERAKEIFIYFNQPLVGWIAKRYLDKGLPWPDLLSAGNVGLLQAVNRFDPSKGTRFSTFAVPWIAGELKQLFKSTKKGRLSDRAIRATENGVPLVDVGTEEEEEEVVDGSTLDNNCAPSEDESEEDSTLKDASDLQEAVAQDAETESGLGMNPLQARSEGIGSIGGGAEFSASLRGEDPHYDGKPGGGHAINFAPDYSIGAMSVDVNLIPALERALDKLEDPRQVMVFAMRLGLRGHKQQTSFAEIGKALGVSAQRAHDIQQQVFTTLRKDPTLQLLFEQTL